MADPTRTPSDIYPSLTYDDAPAAIEWLCRVFGFEQRLIVPGEDGAVRHSELSIGSGVIMVSSPKDGRVGPRRVQGRGFGLCVHVDDPEAHHDRAKAAGARIVQGLRDEDYGSRGYMVEDIEGYVWYFATYRPGAWWQ